MRLLSPCLCIQASVTSHPLLMCSEAQLGDFTDCWEPRNSQRLNLPLSCLLQTGMHCYILNDFPLYIKNVFVILDVQNIKTQFTEKMKMMPLKCNVITETLDLFCLTATSNSSVVISRSCLQCLSAVVRRREGGCTTPVAKGTAVCKVLFWRRGGSRGWICVTSMSVFVIIKTCKCQISSLLASFCVYSICLLFIFLLD